MKLSSLGYATLVLVVSTFCVAQRTTLPADLRPPSLQPNIVCGSGFSDADCGLATGIVRLALEDLRSAIPEWRWVVVPETHWAAVATSFRIKPTTPAFSSLTIHTTYVEASLVLPAQRIDENLQSYSRLRGKERLRWVLAHESGHILCQTSDEGIAEAAAKKIEYGNRSVCR